MPEYTGGHIPCVIGDIDHGSEPFCVPIHVIPVFQVSPKPVRSLGKLRTGCYLDRLQLMLMVLAPSCQIAIMGVELRPAGRDQRGVFTNSEDRPKMAQGSRIRTGRRVSGKAGQEPGSLGKESTGRHQLRRLAGTSNGSAGIEGAEKAEGERSRADLHGPQDRGEDKTRIRGRIDRRRIRAHQRNKIIVQARIGLLRSEKAVRASETRLAVLKARSDIEIAPVHHRLPDRIR